jgi:hypothetical protein
MTRDKNENIGRVELRSNKNLLFSYLLDISVRLRFVVGGDHFSAIPGPKVVSPDQIEGTKE